MKKFQSSLLAERLTLFSKYAGLLAAFIGLLVFLGWIFNIPALKSVIPGLSTMKANTAIAFILSGAVLWFMGEKQESAIRIFLKQLTSSFVFLIGLLTLSQTLFNLDFGIDQLFFQDTQTAPQNFPGRMAFAAALCFTLIGLSLLFLTHQREKIRIFSQYFSVIVLVISALALIGYVYDVQALYKLDAYSSMALHTAFAFTLSSLAILFVRPNEGWSKVAIAESAGGVVLRRLIPPILIVPLSLGWLILLGESAGLYETHFGIAIISVLIAGFLVLTLFINGNQLNSIDQNLKQAQARYRNVLDTMLEGCHIIDFDWRYLYVNETGAKHGRQDSKNLLGKTMLEAYSGIETLDLFHMLKNCMEVRVFGGMETEFFYPDGTSGWFEFNVQPVEEGIFILTIEITERKHAEKALQQLNFELEQRITERTAHLDRANQQLQEELSLRQQAESSLRQNEAHYRALFEQSNDAVFILDFQGNHITVNQHAAEMLGYSLDEIQHFSYTDLSAETKKSEQVLKRLLAGERVPVFERLFRKKSGETFPVEMNVELVRDDLGNPIHIQSIVRDITQRKQAEEALRQSEEKYRSLIESLPAITYISSLDEAKTRRYVSAQNEKYLGFSPDEWLADPDLWRKQLHPDDRERVQAEAARFYETGEPFISEYRTLSRNGVAVWFHDEAVIIRDTNGQPQYIQGVKVNITAHKQAEEALREAETKYRTLIENMPAVVYLNQVDSAVLSEYQPVYDSPQLEIILGYSPQEFIENPDLWPSLLHPEDRERALAEDARHFETGEPLS